MKQGQLRNFVIISHIDHGKSTLADRFLELTGRVSPKKMRKQYLDMMDLEREKGITIKLKPVRLTYFFNSKPYVLNLIDTPGHVDFSYEVSRSLAAVEGAILLVDATKGIQAQTIANLELAKKQNLVIIPAVNKIDLPQAKVEETKDEISKLLDVPKTGVFEISAKLGKNCKELLEAVIEKIPPPDGSKEKPFRALIFDSKYDPFKGVLAYVKVVEGELKKGDKIYLIKTGAQGEVKEIGWFLPELAFQEKLTAGEIGYIATGIKEIEKVRVGETVTTLNSGVEPLPGYHEPKPVVFASIYPENSDDFDSLKKALFKLRLTDASLIFELEQKEVLGRGFRCGFLGKLHIEIILERLHREFGLNLIVSTPQVLYKIITREEKELFIFSPLNWPEQNKIKEIQEPWAKVEIICPVNYLGRIFEVLEQLEGKQEGSRYLTQDKLILCYQFPLREIIIGLYDKIKSASQGFASLNYEISGWRKSDLVKIEVLIAGKKEEVFSEIVERSKANQSASKIVKKLKETLPPQQFQVPLQAKMGGKIIARETIRARQKDVLAPLYGGDYTRKRKLLERQKRGKKKLKERGQVRIPLKVFLEIFKSK